MISWSSSVTTNPTAIPMIIEIMREKNTGCFLITDCVVN